MEDAIARTRPSACVHQRLKYSFGVIHHANKDHIRRIIARLYSHKAEKGSRIASFESARLAPAWSRLLPTICRTGKRICPFALGDARLRRHSIEQVCGSSNFALAQLARENNVTPRCRVFHRSGCESVFIAHPRTVSFSPVSGAISQSACDSGRY